jgi:hypothetical protein
VIQGIFRIWKCGAKVLGSTISGEKQAYYCNWGKAELGTPFSRH